MDTDLHMWFCRDSSHSSTDSLANEYSDFLANESSDSLANEPSHSFANKKELLRKAFKLEACSDTEYEGRQKLKLYEKAAEDYFSVELWVKYALYSIGVCNVKETRAILRKGLKSVGFHVSEGSLLWDTLQKLEIALISYYPKCSKNWRKQINRVDEVFNNQVSLPLLNIENAYLQWTEWYQTIPEGYVNAGLTILLYEEALKILQVYKPFEDKLLSAKEEDLYDIYKEYIKSVKYPSMVICLYERAIVNLHLNPIVWEDYIKFSFNMKEVALKVSEKAVRYCPWSEKLWVWRLRVLENCMIDENEVVECIEKALSDTCLSSRLNLWMCYLGYSCRNFRHFRNRGIKKKFLQGLRQITVEEDPTFKLHRWYARFEAKRGCVVKAKNIWTKTIFFDPNMKVSVDAWLEFARLQIEFGEPRRVRYGFKNALHCCKEWAPKIEEEWLSFEREVGSLEEIIKCEEDCRKFMTDLTKQVGNKRTNETEQDCNSKRLKESENMDQNVLPTNMDQNVLPSNMDQNVLPTNMDQNVLPTNMDQNVLPSTSGIIKKDLKTSVLVNNLCHTVTEQDLRDSFPNAVKVTLILNTEGESRCFAYIQFANREDFGSALAREIFSLKGRSVGIDPMM